VERNDFLAEDYAFDDFRSRGKLTPNEVVAGADGCFEEV
jgi:hypothetical protein